MVKKDNHVIIIFIVKGTMSAESREEKRAGSTEGPRKPMLFKLSKILLSTTVLKNILF